MSGGLTDEQRALLELATDTAVIITDLVGKGSKFSAPMVIDELEDMDWRLEELAALLPLMPGVMRAMPPEAQDAAVVYAAMAAETRRRMEESA